MILTMLADKNNIYILAAALVCVLFLLYRIVTRAKRRGRNSREVGILFEKELAKVFKKNGFDVELTQTSHDFGADLIMYYDDVKYVVQAKYYMNTVGLSAVQEAFTAMHYFDADRSVVVTNSTFSSTAITLAEKVGTILIDGDGLARLKKGKIDILNT